MMQLGVDGVFVGSGIFKADDPERRAKAIVEATTHYDNPDILAKVSIGLGEAMSGMDVRSMKPEEMLASRGLVARSGWNRGGGRRRRRQEQGYGSGGGSSGMTIIGVLALQGDFAEHGTRLEELGAEPRRVRLPEDLDGLDGLIIPGGETTTFDRLLSLYGLAGPVRRLADSGVPVWGTCAGLIALAERVVGRDRPLIGMLDVEVERNAYGRQVDSFETDIDVPAPRRRRLPRRLHPRAQDRGGRPRRRGAGELARQRGGRRERRRGAPRPCVGHGLPPRADRRRAVPTPIF